MKIPEAVKKVLKESDYVRVATCSDGIPNVNIVYYFKLIDDERILLADNFFNKTRRNLKNNPYAAINVKSSEDSTSYEIKGSVEIHTEGEVYEEMRKWVLSEEELPAKAAVVMVAEKVFDETPGEKAGSVLPN